MNGVERPGRIRPAPEQRRSFLRKSLGLAGGAAASAFAARSPAAGLDGAGDPAILKLPAHSTGLGQPVAARGYGMPSEYEKNLQRRESPGLTRVPQASVAFAPLQEKATTRVVRVVIDDVASVAQWLPAGMGATCRMSLERGLSLSGCDSVVTPTTPVSRLRTPRRQT